MQILRRWISSTARTSHEPFLGFNTGINRVKGNDLVYVAMSGGVDSSTVAALLAKKFGRERVRGVFMNNWSSTSKCQETSWRAVQQVCKYLELQCHRVDLERDYWSEVFEPMLNAYQQGLTPNPDVGCNRSIKFGRLIEHLRERDPKFSWIATGHYAGVTSNNLVKRASYLRKDQSYYLATIKSDVLANVIFPLADLEKPIVRKLAMDLGLVEVAQKPDSQGLCFVEQQQEVGQRGFRNFLAEYLVESPGPIVTAKERNKIVGEHKGLWTHTIGQRASVAMPQMSPESRGQWFVVGKDIKNNALLIDRGTNSPLLFVDRILSNDFQWHKLPSDGTILFAQYRSLQEPWEIAKVKRISSDCMVFDFKVPRRAVAPGQYLVIYEDDAVIGAGTISEAVNSK